MFFYDMYLVDKGETDCTKAGQIANEGECLYPVPVLIRNLRKDAAKPNENFEPLEEVNDIFVRRFFLHDNMSGKKDGSLSILRYAKTIVMQVMITPEDPSRIFAPILTIEYVERRPAAWSNRLTSYIHSLMAVDEVVFKSEYTMDTTEFWSNVEILIGFMSAVASVMWLARVRNWQTRNQRIGATNPNSGEATGTSYMIHVLMMLAHTFVVSFAFKFLELSEFAINHISLT